MNVYLSSLGYQGPNIILLLIFIALFQKTQIQQRQLQADEQSMFQELDRLVLEEQTFLSEIQKEYGDGDLDTTTGEFIAKEQQ